MCSVCAQVDRGVHRLAATLCVRPGVQTSWNSGVLKEENILGYSDLTPKKNKEKTKTHTRTKTKTAN